MRCDEARDAWLEARYGHEPVPDVREHFENCPTCQTFVAKQQQLDRALASLHAPGPSASFDARFYVRLDAQRKPRHIAGWAWLSVPLAAAAALLLFQRAHTLPVASSRPHTTAASADLVLTRELELVQSLDVVSRLDEIESFDVLSQLDDADLREVSGGAP